MLELGPLEDAAAFELLGSLGADETRSRAIAAFARGHPLALVIAGGVLQPPARGSQSHAATRD